jgi:hypothetical protein
MAGSAYRRSYECRFEAPWREAGRCAPIFASSKTRQAGQEMRSRRQTYFVSPSFERCVEAENDFEHSRCK